MAYQAGRLYKVQGNRQAFICDYEGKYIKQIIVEHGSIILSLGFSTPGSPVAFLLDKTRIIFRGNDNPRIFGFLSRAKPTIKTTFSSEK